MISGLSQGSYVTHIEISYISKVGFRSGDIFTNERNFSK